MRRVAVAAMLIPGWALAHPVDEVMQGAYLTLAPGRVELLLEMTPGADVADAVLGALDADGNRIVTLGEARTFARQVLDKSALTLDGVEVPWVMLSVTVPSYDVLAQSDDLLRIEASAVRADKMGAHVLSCNNAYVPATILRFANIFLRSDGNWTYAVTGQDSSEDGSALTVEYTAAQP
jgi:hypothetical protein